MKVGWLLLGLGFGVLALPVFLGEVQTAPDALAYSPLLPNDDQILESTARERCEAALSGGAPGGIVPEFTALAARSRPLNGGRAVKVTFSAKNSRNIQLDFCGWCEVWADGRTEVVSVTEIAGRDFLASSQPPTIRSVYLQNVKTSKSQADARRFYTVVTNRNDFSIKDAEVTCRISYTDAARYDDKTVKIDRVVPAGGSTTFQLTRPSDAQTMTCRVADFLKVGSGEQRLIDAFGSAGGQSSYSRLRQDAIRVGVPVDILVAPYITIAKNLASNQR